MTAQIEQVLRGFLQRTTTQRIDDLGLKRVVRHAVAAEHDGVLDGQLDARPDLDLHTLEPDTVGDEVALGMHHGRLLIEESRLDRVADGRVRHRAELQLATLAHDQRFGVACMDGLNELRIHEYRYRGGTRALQLARHPLIRRFEAVNQGTPPALDLARERCKDTLDRDRCGLGTAGHPAHAVHRTGDQSTISKIDHDCAVLVDLLEGISRAHPRDGERPA